MVIDDKLIKKLDELENFFSSVKKSVKVSESDRHTATYGLSKIEAIKDLVDRYREKPKNTYLKQIHNTFFSVTRGVEFFIDAKTNESFKEKCKGIYEIIETLESAIKW